MKKILGLILFFMMTLLPVVGNAQLGVDALIIYKQAKLKNYNFLKNISEYGALIDITNGFGDTAYCIALKYNDMETAKVLRFYGADKNHQCIAMIRSGNPLKGYSHRYQGIENPGKGVQSVRNTTNYWAWSLGIVAAGGTVGALGGGSGGSSDGTVSNGKDNNDESTRGEENTGEDTDDGNNGNLPTNPPLDDKEDENNGQDNSGGGNEETRGEEGNDGNGGNDENNTISSQQLSKDFFENNEYEKGNFLSYINASAAYTKIYTKDENDKLVGHQAGSSDKLKTIKVGVLDSGIFHNNEIKYKIVGEYDANEYNSERNVRVYVRDGIHYYIIANNNKYYFLPVNTETGTIYSLGDRVFDNINSLENEIYKYYGLEVKDFKIVNNAYGSPGSENDITDDYQTWWKFINELSHGTHVAGIIAGNKNNYGMHGVAFDNAQIITGSWDLESDIYATIKNMVDDGVKVVNNSWGVDISDTANASNPEWLAKNDKDFLMAYSYAANNKAVWVQATGNDGAAESDVHTAAGMMNLSSYGYNGPAIKDGVAIEVPFIAVAALDGNTADSSAPSGKIAEYSNHCGSAANYCISAPGTDIVSTNASDDGYITMSGTSMATPVVSGSIALLNGYYPWLNAQNVAYLLLETANDSGVYANSSVYGQGALDLDAAVTTPLGDLKLPQRSDLNSLQSASLSKLSMSGVLQNKLLKMMPKTVTAYDILNRPFQYETSKLVNTTHSSSANLKNSVSHVALGQRGVKTVRDEKSGFSFSSSNSMDAQGYSHLSSVEVSHTSESGSNRFYYASNSKYMDSQDVLVNDNNPYLAMRDAYGAENVTNLSENSKLKLSLQSGLNGLYERDEDQDVHSFDNRSYSFGAEYSFNLQDYLEVSTLGGMLFEEGALLGLNGIGGFGISDSQTYYMGLKAKLDLTKKVSLLAAYYRGYTSGSDSSMLSISDLETESFMLAGEYQLNKDNKFGLMLSSPMSVVKGNASFMYSTGRDNNSNTAYLKELKTSLKPTAKEYDFGMYYQGNPRENLSISGKFETRFNADGEKGQEDYVGVVGAQFNF